MTPYSVTFDLDGEKNGQVLVEFDVTNEKILINVHKTGYVSALTILPLGICADIPIESCVCRKK